MTYQIKNNYPHKSSRLKIASGIAILVALGTFTPTLQAQGIEGIAWIAGEIRGQIALVNAQAEATLCDCDDYEDVQEELEELSEKMSRFERLLTEPIRNEHAVRRLRKAAKKVDDQAEEVVEEIEDAIEDLRDDRPRNRHHARYSAYGQLPPSRYMLPPRVALAQQFGFTVPNRGIPNRGFSNGRIDHQLAFANHPANFRSGGIQISLGGGRPQIRFVSNATVAGPLLAHSQFAQPTYPSHYLGNGVHGDASTNALCAEANRLRTLTRELVRLL